jgi:hypothetical protein
VTIEIELHPNIITSEKELNFQGLKCQHRIIKTFQLAQIRRLMEEETQAKGCSRQEKTLNTRILMKATY